MSGISLSAAEIEASRIEVAYKAGDTQNFPDLSPKNAFVHDLTNTGDTDLVFVTAEFDPAHSTDN